MDRMNVHTEVINGMPTEELLRFLRLPPRAQPRYRFTASLATGNIEATMTGVVDAVNYADAEQQINAMIKALGVDDWHIDSIEQG